VIDPARDDVGSPVLRGSGSWGGGCARGRLTPGLGLPRQLPLACGDPALGRVIGIQGEVTDPDARVTDERSGAFLGDLDVGAQVDDIGDAPAGCPTGSAVPRR